MKRFPRHPKAKSLNSFTLVELLTVICIIAILAAVLISAGSGAIRSAKQAKAANTASGIQTAVVSYYTEYSVYPKSGATADYALTDIASAQTEWGQLIECLSGNIKPSTGVAIATSSLGSYGNNTRGVGFLSLKSSDVDAKDAPLNPLPGKAGAATYFNIAFDNDYDGTIGSTGALANSLPSFSGATVTSGGTTTAGVAVWANCNGTTGKNNPNWYVHTY